MRLQSVNCELKYKCAISLYAESALSIKTICEQTGVGFSAFSSYLSKHHRELVLKRHNLAHLSNVRLRGKRGQSTASRNKYNEAISACDSSEYLEYNISQIARIFNVDCSSLANQLRRHYPDIVPRRENERRRMGITINLQYGARRCSKEGYAQAVEMLQTSDKTIAEVAASSGVSYSGLREHILAYHTSLITNREEKRTKASGQRKRGCRTGNWQLHEPCGDSVERYKEALQLYSTTSMDIKEIARITSVDSGSFRYHLRTWYPELTAVRGMIKSGTGRCVSNRSVEKYAEALHLYGSTSESLKSIANRLGLTYNSIGGFIRRNYPELIIKHNSLLG